MVIDMIMDSEWKAIKMLSIEPRYHPIITIVPTTLTKTQVILRLANKAI